MAPEGLRWALAGRNQQKLEAVRDRLGVPELPLLHAEVGDPASLAEVAAGTKVVITTVGPYINYGEPLVKACADAGTDYVDLTGEPEFVDLMYVRHHARAVETGARIIHCCGFDSIPHDLGAYFTVKQLPEGVPLKVEGFVTANGTFSGGTLDSAVTAMSRLQADQEGRRRPQGHRAAARGAQRPRGAGQAPAIEGGRWLGAAHAHDRPHDRQPLGARAWIATARTSPTPTTSRPRTPTWPQAPPRAPAAWWRWPRSGRRGTGFAIAGPPAPDPAPSSAPRAGSRSASSARVGEAA